ncbi:hypothetical protein B5X24_HaOG207329 [Helicoverpa armigera]|uniref:Uncharacterized protein n=1 Tax=Helicoverpa armigera TaxID=29058 RepID=A0A2W1BM63_HELAM|nr:hypothetical protein B5X24_HaOG207329 [Helicoverpa armigera]
MLHPQAVYAKEVYRVYSNSVYVCRMYLCTLLEHVYQCVAWSRGGRAHARRTARPDASVSSRLVSSRPPCDEYTAERRISELMALQSSDIIRHT